MLFGEYSLMPSGWSGWMFIMENPLTLSRQRWRPMSSHLRRCCISYIKVWSRIQKKCIFACRLYSESGGIRWLKNIKRYYDASVLMSWNFATSLLSSERSTVVAQLCIIMHSYYPVWVLWFAGTYSAGLLLCLFYDSGQCEGLKTWNERRARHHAFYFVSVLIRVSVGQN